MGRRVLSGDEFFALCYALADRVDGEYDYVVAIATGGTYVGGVLAKCLGIPMLVVGIKSYKGERKDRLHVYQWVDVKGDVLLVDDIVDTGETLAYAKSKLEEDGCSVRTATLFVKPWARIVPNYYVEQTEDWIVFPWELKESFHK